MTRGERVCAFIERYCHVPEGVLVGKPVRLSVFQEVFILAVYDNPHGTNEAILSIGRKNAKTALAAFLLLAHIAGPEAQINSELMSGARSRDQAAKVFNYAAKVIRFSPELSKICKIIPSSKQIMGLVMNTEYKASSAEAKTAHGGSPALAILDETGQVKGPIDDYIEAIETSQGAHENPLRLHISTQAATAGDMLSIIIDDAEASKNPHTVCHVYSAPEDCDVMDKKGWLAANPAMGEFRSAKELEDWAEKASRLPAKENSFRWLYLNQRIEANSPFVNRKEWEVCKGASVLSGRVYGGLDLSSNRDLTSLVLVSEADDGVFDVEAHHFLPDFGILDKSKEDRVPYDLWAKQGHMTLLPGKVIDPALVARHLASLSGKYDIDSVAYDRWRIEDFRRELDAIGCDIYLEKFGQGYRDMSPAVDELERLIAEGKLRHGGNPVLNMCAANAIIESDPAGNRKLTKAKSRGRIDGMVALAMAIGASKRGVEIEASPFDDPNYVFTG